MKVVSGRFISKKELRNKIFRDVLLVIIFLAIITLIYFQIRSPIPVKFLFRSLFQDVKNSVVEEYSKIYYPTYYFSIQMTPLFDIASDNLDDYKVLITNFFPRHNFIEKATMKFGYSFLSIVKDKGGYNVLAYIDKNKSIKDFKDALIPYEQLSIDSFYIKNRKPYIHLLYIANESIGFEYISEFNIDFSNLDVGRTKDIYAYLLAGNSTVTFPIEDIEDSAESISNSIVYTEIANMLTKEFLATKEDVVKVQYNNKSYWGYRGTFSVANNTNGIGIIIPETEVVKKLELPAIFIIALILILIIFIIIFITMHYLRIIEELKTNHMNIKKIIEDGESTIVEFKSTLRYDHSTEKINKALEEVIMKSIAAFANTEGGRLFIGIGNYGDITGLEYDYSTLKHPNRDFFELHLRTVVETYYGNAFSSQCIRIDFVEEDGKDICIVYIRKSIEPIYTKITNKQGAKEEKFFIRVGNSSRELSNTSEVIDYIKKHFKKL